MKRIFILLIFCCEVGSAQNWKLLWSDEFDGTELNPKHWNYETGNGEGGWGTGQMDYCTDRPENVKVSKGKLKLGITKEDIGGFHYTAGRINSRNKITAKYGRIEARIRIPAGKGIGAAFWMLPQDERFGWWPRSGEIDILETNGHEIHRNYGTVHYMLSEQRKYTGHDIITSFDLNKEFHVYALEWDEKIMKWYLDDSLYHTFSIAEPIDGRTPFNERFFFILSTGVGSDFSGKQIDDKLLPQAMEVDYLRVYKRVNKPALKKVVSNIAGTELELHFSEQVKPDPSLVSFSLKGEAAGNVIAVQNKYRENHILVLKLSSPLTSGDYSISIANAAIKSIDDQLSDAVQDFPVINTTDGAAPTMLEARLLADSYTAELSLSKPVAMQTSYEGIHLTRNGNAEAIQIERDSLRMNKLLIRTEIPFMKKDSIRIDYREGNLKSKEGKSMLSGSVRSENELPFKTIIPGIVEAEHYAQQNGVQKENCLDATGGENLGYIDDRDSFEFLVYVKEDGDYKMIYRAAVMNYNATLITEIGGQKVKSVLPQTFGWQTWKDSDSEYFTLKRGVYRMKCSVERGGFNLNWIRFEKR